MIAALLFAALAQCGPSGCPAPVVAPSYRMQMPVVQPAYRVVEHQAPPRHYAWRPINCDGMSFKVWGFVTTDGLIEWNPDLPANAEQYRLAEAAKAKAAQAARQPRPEPKPEPEPKPKAAEPPAEKNDVFTNYGVDPTRLNKGNQIYTANSAEAASFVRESQLKSDHKQDRCYVTVIGDARDRKKVADDWNNNPAFSEWHDKVWFQQFKKNDWQVQDSLGYAADGSPTILVQKPDGQVLLRMANYAGPAPIVNALRKADPHYRPDRDPGPDEPEFGIDDSHAYLAVGAVCVALLVILPRRKK